MGEDKELSGVAIVELKKLFPGKKVEAFFRKFAIFEVEDDEKICVADWEADGDEPVSKSRKKRDGEEEVGVESRR